MTVVHVRAGSAKPRSKPKPGDMRWVKSRQRWEIRQQVRHKTPGFGVAYQVSNGRPVYEWVARHGADDRQWQWQWQIWGGDPSGAMQHRQAIESNCVCLREGHNRINPHESPKLAVTRMTAACRCNWQAKVTETEKGND